MKRNLNILLIILLITSCANPTVVNVIQPRDNEMSCKELNSEIAKANQYADEAQEAKKANKPHNVGAILFFLPGLFFSMDNIEEATKAAKNRAIHLNKIKEKKNC
tara:strand:+ start:837 stop:1151 length:315 start_codon:yes stop_codon:yes gene_type:complete